MDWCVIVLFEVTFTYCYYMHSIDAAATIMNGVYRELNLGKVRTHTCQPETNK